MSDTHAYDAIVIGGGHNGLTNAAYLAQAGKRVQLVDGREVDHDAQHASAFDVATLASQESIHYGYRRFREEHVDRFGLREWVVIASIVIAFLAASIAAYVLIE